MAKRFKQHEIDEVMRDVSELPKGFTNWIISAPFKDRNYLFYKCKNNKKSGLCSKCGNLMTLKDKKKHNDSGRCPSCKAKVIYKAINKAKSYRDDEIVSIMQKMPEGYIVRYLKVRRIFKTVNHDTSNFPNSILETLYNPFIESYEGSRVYISFGKRGGTQYRNFEKDWSYSNGDYRWVNERRRGGFNNTELLRASNPVFYKRNIKHILKDSKWKYCGLDHYKGRFMNIDDYLSTYEEYPAIEMLSKLNYQTLLNQIIYGSCYWGGIGGILKMNEKRLGLSSQVFSKARELDLNIEEIEFICTLEDCEKNISDDHIRWAIKHTNTETFVQLMKWVSPQRIINYVEKYTDEKGSKDINSNSPYIYRGHFTTIWRDYLQMCESLEIKLTKDIHLFPKNLKEKHDEYSTILKVKANKKLDEGIKVQYDKWNDLLSYKNGLLRIEVASSHQLILDESKALDHCVGRSRAYATRMTEGKQLILFIRKNDKPYYTVELDVENLKVLQNRGYDNKGTNNEVKKFISKWKVKKLLVLRGMESMAI